LQRLCADFESDSGSFIGGGEFAGDLGDLGGGGGLLGAQPLFDVAVVGGDETLETQLALDFLRLLTAAGGGQHAGGQQQETES